MIKKTIIFIGVTFFALHGADAATVRNARGGVTNAPVTATRSATARSATTTRSAPSVRNNGNNNAGVAPARAATAGRTTVSRTPTTAATTTNNTTARSATVTARAGSTQKVINTGTTVAAATKNTAGDTSCQQKYLGCMDSFCMIQNENGGRCVCSNKNAEFDSILAEIEKLDRQSYEIATVGVDSIKNDYDINAVYETADSAKSASVDLSLWDTFIPDDEPINNQYESTTTISDKTGDELFIASDEICAAAMPECANELEFLRLMYHQQINNDCAAYENGLKQQKNASIQKLEAAQQALRQAAYTRVTDDNKYDLGQCTIEFKNCMMTTGGCGDDFAGCASVAAFDATNTRGDTHPRSYSINGTSTNIEISASTYDILLSKKPLCDTVTKQCQLVADQVWDTFLRESAPQIKNAELIAEDNARQDCIGNISSCFQTACRDNIDPNDPDGSYDMCLTRPETMLSLCTVPLNACGIDSTSASAAEKSPIWEFVMARLASMRVNSCTTEFKECLQSTDRCGEDYTQCIGLDTDTIIRMCPYDTLVGCQQLYGENQIRGESVYDELYNVAQGIFLNIDNEMLDYCQTALDESVIRACGDTESCETLGYDSGIGSRSLEYKICDYVIDEENNSVGWTNCRNNISQVTDSELGRVVGSTVNALGPITPLSGVIEGTIWWDGVTIADDGNICSVDEYFKNIDSSDASDKEIQMVSDELDVLHSDIERVFNLIESDPTVQFCMTGREVDGIKPYSGTVKPRFPQLTNQIRNKITTDAINKARKNYYDKYNELVEQQSMDYVTITERMAEIQGENAKDARREIARQACVGMAEMSGVSKTKTPKGLGGIITMAAILVAAAVVVTIFTAGAGTAAIAALSAVAIKTAIGVAGTVGSAAIVGLVAGPAATDWSDTSRVNYADLQLSGAFEVSNWNYRENITTNFDMETLVCHKCIKSQNCATPREPFFGNLYCKTWAEPVEVCTDIQF